eukprot:NODE_170_length_14437_cov_1.447273.p4 type:complete len:340 gc:universal NODE_170_length_14437_cov_1.447273:8608-9627(+)
MNQLTLALLTTMSFAKVIEKRSEGVSGKSEDGNSLKFSKGEFKDKGKDAVGGKKFEIEFETDSNKKLEIKSRNGNIGGRFLMNLEGIPFIRAGIWNKHGGGFDKDSFRVSLLRIAEVASNETAATATNYIRLTGKKNNWSKIQTQKSVTSDGISIYQFSTSLLVGSCNITLTALYADQIASAVQNNQSSTLTPLRFKYGIQVDKFPFTHGGSLVLVKSVKSTKVDKDSDSTVSTNSGTFEWSGNVTVDGVTKLVKASKLDVPLNSIISSGDHSEDGDSDGKSDDLESLYGFDLGSGKSINWDPSLNLESAVASTDNTGSSSAMLSSIQIIALAGAILLT